VKHVRTFGSTWIGEQIRENKRLRMLIPRVYGLGDLSQILDERAYLQARLILELDPSGSCISAVGATAVACGNQRATGSGAGHVSWPLKQR